MRFLQIKFSISHFLFYSKIVVIILLEFLNLIILMIFNFKNLNYVTIFNYLRSSNKVLNFIFLNHYGELDVNYFIPKFKKDINLDPFLNQKLLIIQILITNFIKEFSNFNFNIFKLRNINHLNRLD